MITIYSTGCPKCEILKEKLKNKDVDFEVETDVGIMKDLGISEVPILKIDDELLSFKDAVNWINKR